MDLSYLHGAIWYRKLYRLYESPLRSELCLNFHTLNYLFTRQRKTLDECILRKDL